MYTHRSDPRIVALVVQFEDTGERYLLVYTHDGCNKRMPVPTARWSDKPVRDMLLERDIAKCGGYRFKPDEDELHVACLKACGVLAADYASAGA